MCLRTSVLTRAYACLHIRCKSISYGYKNSHLHCQLKEHKKMSKGCFLCSKRYGMKNSVYSFSVICSIMTAHEASPVTDIIVRPMSTSRSIPATIATPSIGMPAEANTIAIRASEPPGMPGVPIEAIVLEKAMARY